MATQGTPGRLFVNFDVIETVVPRHWRRARERRIPASPMSTSVPITNLLQSCAALLEPAPPTQDLLEVTRAFVLDVAGRDSIPHSILAAFDDLPPHGAAWLAVSLGSAVEKGLDPSLAGDRLLQVFRSWLERTKDGQDPERVAALPTLCQALVAHLSRLDSLRSMLAADAPFLAELEKRESMSHGITWIRELIARRSGDLFVVHGETQRVVHLAFRNVHRCYHLFSLVQSVLGSAFPGGRIPNAAVASAARGQSEEPVTDHGWWHYQRSGAKPSMKKAVWGEESVDVLLRPDGARVLILWEPLLGDRKWNSGFFGPTLEAAMPDMRFLAELSPEAATPWIAAMESPLS